MFIGCFVYRHSDITFPAQYYNSVQCVSHNTKVDSFPQSLLVWRICLIIF
jgi:hypothetical protein